MGKSSPVDGGTKTPKQRRRTRRSGNKYLKPGALAQLRYTKATSKSITDIGKKRVGLEVAKKTDDTNIILEDNVTEKSPQVTSPEKFVISSPSPVDSVKQNNLLRTPKTPCAEECYSESRLEALPLDVLVKVLCHLHHDQLRAVFHVSQRIRKAVVLARKFHFNFTTPDRSRQEMLSIMTPLPKDHWPFMSRGESKSFWKPIPRTPKAPRQGQRPPSRLKQTEMKQIAAALFQESTFPSRCMVPSVLSKPICKNRVLFCEDELCQAVAQNKLR